MVEVTSVDIDVRFEAEEVIAIVVLRDAFEGAPGRAHGGIVAAAFDDVTGFVIGLLHEPAFTGELTVRYVKPVPVNTALESLAFESLAELLGGHLDGHIPSDAGIASAIDLAHAARANLRDDFVRAEFVTNGEQHRTTRTSTSWS